jgi:hypothetical protein
VSSASHSVPRASSPLPPPWTSSWPPTLGRSSKLDEFKPYLTQRWNEGCDNAVQLHHEIQSQGFTGSRRAVQGWLKPLRGHQKVRQEPCPPPKPRRVTGWIMTHPDRLDTDNKTRLQQILTRCPDLTSPPDTSTASPR